MSVNAVVAVLLGVVTASLLLIPTAAVQYRRDGRLGLNDLTALFAGAVYGAAIWSYTLLPLPAPGRIRCQGSQLRVFGSLESVRLPPGASASALLHEPEFLQVALNLLLFMPLGYFLRALVRRGVVVATISGFGLSLLIELTQLTGVWHLYPCAYRVFDVDDLLVNTLGAAVGSVLSILIVRRRHPDVRLPTTISFGRRLVGMICDGLFVVVTGVALAVAWRAYQLLALHRTVQQLDLVTQNIMQWGVPFVVEAILVLTLGSTLGELTVSLRSEARTATHETTGRVVKLATGVTPLLLYGVPRVGAGLVLVFVVVSVITAWRTHGHRGVSNILARRDLQIAGASSAEASDGPPPRLRR